MASLKSSRKLLLQRARFVRFLLCVIGVAICLCALIYVQLVKGSVVYREVQTYHTEYVQEPVYTTVTDAVLPTGVFTAPGDGDYTFTGSAADRRG